MASEGCIRRRITETRKFEDDMDSVVYDEPKEESADSLLEDDEEVRYWLDRRTDKPGILGEFACDVKALGGRFYNPLKRRVAWAGTNFIELGIKRYCLVFFLLFVFLTIYFGTLLHETLHIVGAAFVNEIPVGIRLNSMLYSPVAGFLSQATGGFVQSASLNSGNPGSAIILHTDNPLHIAIIGIFPNVLLFMLGFTWLRKGLNEKRPGYFGAGLVFSCSNLEIFIPSLHTDITSTAQYIASVFSITGDDVGGVTIILAAMVVGSGYMLSVLYDRWQKKLVQRQREQYPFDYPAKMPAAARDGGHRING